ncbi:TfoX/Sxy family protein [Dasania sp. GY-MA-18]|uniref:TfoX/Sxy family protein n=1 Tax=Dasania phycosphaerae TaxID=2950436 RepID=A0A9J6RH56_9GAMM|nr:MULTISPECIES: TfoX/Sxy family protein [Dasania]MCR8921229.1 TfoX/Sxy family protein [Dasania sp. GY-MA-18]MCZ0863657.1 TfoX/Sxy family protein [Dasania phycosphaerae]MCZ0867385.1 TfoX/Sxy family protein [Dasania phycosphaerae]
MQNDLLDLKNLGNTSINWLKAIGINSYEDLKNIGPVEAYTQIKQREIKVSKVFLYALQGALTDTHWNDLAPSLKQQLVEEAEKRLSTT